MRKAANVDTGSVVQRLLRLVDILPVSGAKSPQQLYNWIEEERFPRPIKIGEGRAVAWIEAEICAWQKQQMAERDARAAAKAERKAAASM